MAEEMKILKPKTVLDNRPDDARNPVKLILLGDSAVGKSKLVERFLMQRYVPVQMSTYALTLYRYDFISEDNEEVDVDIWDSRPGALRYGAPKLLPWGPRLHPRLRQHP